MIERLFCVRITQAGAFFYFADAWLNQGTSDIIYLERREKTHEKNVCIHVGLSSNSSRVTDR